MGSDENKQDVKDWSPLELPAPPVVSMTRRRSRSETIQKKQCVKSNNVKSALKQMLEEDRESVGVMESKEEL
jgi:hypothetical protein